MSTSSSNISPESHAVVAAGLKSCSSRGGVNELFSKYNIREKSFRIELLREAMGNPETFYSHRLPEDKMYEQEVSMLLTKAWEINELYARGAAGSGACSLCRTAE